MNKFVVRMLELGAELDKAVSPIEISMVINDAEILYKNHIEQLNIPVVSQQRELLIATIEKVRYNLDGYGALTSSQIAERLEKAINGG